MKLVNSIILRLIWKEKNISSCSCKPRVFNNWISWRNFFPTRVDLAELCKILHTNIFWLSFQKETWIKLIKELLWFVASISYTKGYFRTVMMLNFHAFEYSSGIAPSKVKKKNPNDLKLAHDMEWCHVPFAYQIGPGLIW